jgi:hypothetical protein
MCLLTANRFFFCRLDIVTRQTGATPAPGRTHTEYTSFFKLKQVEYVSTASLGLEVQPTWPQQPRPRSVNIRWYQRLAYVEAVLIPAKY